MFPTILRPHLNAYRAKSRLREERARLISECWAFLRTCHDAGQWEVISHLLWQLKALEI